MHPLRIPAHWLHLDIQLDLLLVKESIKSWSMLEKPANDTILPAGYNITFGVGGRTGTVGGKEIIS